MLAVAMLTFDKNLLKNERRQVPATAIVRMCNSRRFRMSVTGSTVRVAIQLRVTYDIILQVSAPIKGAQCRSWAFLRLHWSAFPEVAGRSAPMYQAFAPVSNAEAPSTPGADFMAGGWLCGVLPHNQFNEEQGLAEISSTDEILYDCMENGEEMAWQAESAIILEELP